jgi:calcineurin-like phosphoesterase family protein
MSVPGVRARRAWLVAVLASTLALLIPSASARADDPLVAAAGDIACGELPSTEDQCHQQATSDLLVGRPLAAVLMLGDAQYDNGELENFYKFYDPTWGRVKAITHPAVGNHEYYTQDAQPYFTYFGAAAGRPTEGWYSFDIGTWHLVVLNSNCGKVGGCFRNSAQDNWLRADLAAHKNQCTLAYWHHPHFSSGPAYDDNSGLNVTTAFWYSLYQAGADVVLGGHDHSYERFAPQDPEGELDLAYGMREIVVGTGGRSWGYFPTPSPHSEVREGQTHGVLELTLHPTSYDWRFVPIAGKTFSDTGTTRCHGAPRDPVVKMSRPKSKLSKAGSLKVCLSCSTGCKTRTQVTVTVGRRELRSSRARRTLEALTSGSVRVKFSRTAYRQIRKAFRKHTRLSAEVRSRASVIGFDKTATAKALLRLRR